MVTFALNAKSDSLQIRSVRLHGAADGLRARQRFESALSDLEPTTLGLTPQALLIVRQIAPTMRLRLDPPGRNVAFGQAVQAELTRNAQYARRPWLHADAAGTEAVLFADESELMACLVRDWLRGTLAGRWWGPTLLGSLPAAEWWRRNLLPRGDLLPAVLSLLSIQGEAVAWVARLGEAEVTQAITAIIAAHAMNILSEWLKPAPLLRGAEHPLSNAALTSPRGQQSKTHIPVPPGGSLQDSIAALRHLIALIPESQANTLTLPQRRLLALALGLQRASGWTRSSAFVAALQALETGNAVVDEDYSPNAIVTANDESRQDDHSMRQDNVLPLLSLQANQPAAMDTVATEAIDSSSPSATNLTDKPMPVVRSAEQLSGAQSEELSTSISESLDQTEQVESKSSTLTLEQLWKAQSEDRTTHNSEPLDPAVQVEAKLSALSSAATEEPFNNEMATLIQQGIQTQFGGIFYLFNVALALGLYGDFTQPRAPGITLSPWDWLALIGRAWFGRDFEQDPVWPLFAELAGRSFEEEPGRNFLPPDSWTVPDEWLKPWDNAVDLTICLPELSPAEPQPLAERSRSQEPGKLSASTPLSQRLKSTAFSSEPKRVKVYATRKRLQIWHEAGFILIEVARSESMAPLAQAIQLCMPSGVLGEVQLVRVYKQPHQLVQPVTGSKALKRWTRWILLYLHARLRRALGDDVPDDLVRLVCCHTARINCTATTLDVHLALAALPIELRIAGLDRDPGWVPAAGRSLAFHFE